MIVVSTLAVGIGGFNRNRYLIVILIKKKMLKCALIAKPSIFSTPTCIFNDIKMQKM